MSAELQHLKLSDEEKKVYLQIVAFSQLSLEELASYTDIEFSDLENILNNLIEKHYVTKIDSLKRYVCKFPFIDTINEFSLIVNDLKTLSEELDSYKKNQKEKLDIEENQRKENLTNEIKLKINSLTSSQKRLNEEYSTTYNSTINNINKEHEKVSAETKELLSNTTAQFEIENMEFTNNWLEKFKKLIDSAFNSLTELKTKLIDQIQTFDSKTTAFLMEFIDSIVTEVSQFSSSSNEIIAQSLNNSQSLSEQSNQNLSSSISLLYSSFNMIIEKISTQFNDLINSNQKSIEDKTKEQSIKFNEQISLEFTAIEEKINTYLNEINQKSTTALTENIENQIAVQNNFLKEIEDDLTNYDEFLTQTNESIIKKLDHQFENYRTEDNTIISNLTSNKSAHIESAKDSITKATDITSNIINESLASNNDIFTKFFENFVSKLKEIENSINETSNSLHSKLKTNFEEILISWEKSLNEFASNSEDSTSLFTSERKESIDKFLVILRNSIKDWSIEQKEKLLYLMTSKDEKKIKIEEIGKEKQQTSVEQLKTIYEETKNDSLTTMMNLKSSMKDLEKERYIILIKQNQDTFSTLSNQIGTLITELSAFSEENETNNQSSLVKLFDNLRSNLSLIHTKLQISTQTTNESMSGKISGLKSGFDSNKDNFSNEMIVITKSTLENSISSHQEILESFTTNFQEEQTSLMSSLSEILSNLENISISQIGFTIKNTLAGLENLSKIQQEISFVNTQTVADIGNVGTALTEFISDQYLVMEENFNQTNNKLMTSTKKSETILGNKSNTLQELENKVDKYSYPNNNSAPVFGLNGAKYHIEKMFDRLKSKMTLFIPNPNHLPEDLILSAKSSKQITIISMFDMEINKDMLKKFVEKDNIQIRSLESSADIPPFIGCDRDAEESLFGSYEKKEFIGMHTTQSEFIELIGKRLISSFSPLAKRISRNDFK